MKRNREAKTYTPDQVAAKQEKAVRFLRDVVGDDDRADDIEDMSLSEYAEHKRIKMVGNPARTQKAVGRRRNEKGGKFDTASSVTSGGGFFSKPKDYWQYRIAGKTFQVRKTQKHKRHRLPVRVSVDTKTGEVFNPVKRVNSGAERCRQYRDRCVPMRDFAFVGDPSLSTTYKLRLDDAAHVRAAMARFSHTRIPKEDVRRVVQAILRAARRFGIDASGFESRYLRARRQNAESRRQRASGATRRNQNDGAAEMYTTFHGQEPDEVLEYQLECEADRDLAALGDLIELDVPQIKKTISFERDRVVLCANAEGTQLFAVGGNQDLSAALELADDPHKEFIDFGPIKTITYRTRKSFDRFQTTDYVHELGEEGGERPRLVYHVPSKHMVFVGGEYSIAPAAADGVSPGIVN